MKSPTFAPVFACLYPGLCDLARQHGYALAVHGTMSHDLDLIAVPWTPEAIEGKALKDVLMGHIAACGYAELLGRLGLSEGAIEDILADRGNDGEDGVEKKPHGRRAWNLYWDNGAKVDLSVMPRIQDQGRRRHED